VQSEFTLQFIFYNPSSLPPVNHLQFECEFFLAKTLLLHRKSQPCHHRVAAPAGTFTYPWNTV